MSAGQNLVDMLDDLESTRMKLRLAMLRREADRPERAAMDVHTRKLRPSPTEPDDDVPIGGYC